MKYWYLADIYNNLCSVCQTLGQRTHTCKQKCHLCHHLAMLSLTICSLGDVKEAMIGQYIRIQGLQPSIKFIAEQVSWDDVKGCRVAIIWEIGGRSDSIGLGDSLQKVWCPHTCSLLPGMPTIFNSRMKLKTRVFYCNSCWSMFGDSLVFACAITIRGKSVMSSLLWLHVMKCGICQSLWC